MKNVEAKQFFQASLYWFVLFFLMMICSIVTGIDGIFAFVGVFSLLGSIVCLIGGIIKYTKNKVENTNTYVSMKEKQILRNQEKQKQKEAMEKEIMERKKEVLQLEAESLIVQARIEIASTLLKNYSNVDKEYVSTAKRISKKNEIKKMLIEQLDNLRQDFERLDGYETNDTTKQEIVSNLKTVVKGMIDKLEDSIYYIEEKELN